MNRTDRKTRKTERWTAICGETTKGCNVFTSSEVAQNIEEESGCTDGVVYLETNRRHCKRQTRIEVGECAGWKPTMFCIAHSLNESRALVPFCTWRYNCRSCAIDVLYIRIGALQRTTFTCTCTCKDKINNYLIWTYPHVPQPRGEAPCRSLQKPHPAAPPEACTTFRAWSHTKKYGV